MRKDRRVKSKNLFMIGSGIFIVLLYINYYGLRKTSDPVSEDVELRDRHVTARRPMRGGDLDPIESAAASTSSDIRSRSNVDRDGFLGGYIPRRFAKQGGDTNGSTIPHILHQTWDTEDIPKSFEKWITSWVSLHPTWEYWLWTLEDAKRLVATHYNEHSPLYDSYTKDIFRSDVLRYFVLHRFGGVYADLDMEALRPIDNITFGYDFLLSEETYEHPFVVREATGPANVLNGFLASRPGHPLLDLAISSLAKYAGLYFGDYLHATGPYFFEEVLRCYLKDPKRVSVDDVTIMPPMFFFPTFDPSESEILANKCFPKVVGRLPREGQLTCRELYATFFKRLPSPAAYADHHWVHAYMLDDEWKTRNTVPLRQIVPHAKKISTVL